MAVKQTSTVTRLTKTIQDRQLDNVVRDISDLVVAVNEGGGSESGVWGISDATGAYTYYTTIALANAAASLGDTIELFADVEETGGVEWILKDGVNYNLNGHTYTLNVATTEDAITDNGVAVTCNILNGQIRRIGGTYNVSNSGNLRIDNGSSQIRTDVTYYSDFGMTVRMIGEVIGGRYISEGGTFGGYIINPNGKISDANFDFTGTLRADGELNNSTVYSSGATAIEGLSASTNVNNCTAHSDGLYGGTIQSGTVSNSTFSSSSSFGIWVNTNANVYNCHASSSASAGIYAFSNTPTGILVENCSGFSTAGIGVLSRTGRILNTSGYSSAAPAFGYGAETIQNCSAVCEWNNVGGHAFATTQVGDKPNLMNCVGSVVNVSANGVNCPAVSNNGYFMNCSFEGCTDILNTSPVGVTNLQANIHDTFGNILLG